MVIVDVEVALARKLQVEMTMLGHGMQHVVKKPQTGVDLALLTSFTPGRRVERATRRERVTK